MGVARIGLSQPHTRPWEHSSETGLEGDLGEGTVSTTPRRPQGHLPASLPWGSPILSCCCPEGFQLNPLPQATRASCIFKSSSSSLFIEC